MPTLLFTVFISIMTILLNQSTEGERLNLEELRWEKRVILLFADSSENENYLKQFDTLTQNTSELEERDIAIVSVFQDDLSTIDGRLIHTDSAKEINRMYNPQKKSFLSLLIGKDGGVKHRSTETISHTILFDIIDQMPMRRREMREQRFN